MARPGIPGDRPVEQPSSGVLYCVGHERLVRCSSRAGTACTPAAAHDALLDPAIASPAGRPRSGIPTVRVGPTTGRQPRQARSGSDLELFLDALEPVAGQRQVAVLTVQGEVEEQ